MLHKKTLNREKTKNYGVPFFLYFIYLLYIIALFIYLFISFFNWNAKNEKAQVIHGLILKNKMQMNNAFSSLPHTHTHSNIGSRTRKKEFRIWSLFAFASKQRNVFWICPGFDLLYKWNVLFTVSVNYVTLRYVSFFFFFSFLSFSAIRVRN